MIRLFPEALNRINSRAILMFYRYRYSLEASESSIYNYLRKHDLWGKVVSMRHGKAQKVY